MESSKPGVRDFFNKAFSNLIEIHDAIIESCISQAHHANYWQKEELPYKKGDKVFLSTKNLAFPKSMSCKLMPKYNGPYPITWASNKESRYTI